MLSGDGIDVYKPDAGARALQQAEDVEQQYLFSWARAAACQYRELDYLYHVPNEGKRSRAAGAKLKAMGLKSGVPDICLPVPKGDYHGAYIELKCKTNVATTRQKEWLRFLRRQGYYCAVCYGWQAAADVLEDYLNGKLAEVK